MERLNESWMDKKEGISLEPRLHFSMFLFFWHIWENVEKVSYWQNVRFPSTLMAHD
jgi:hypothetical protein